MICVHTPTCFRGRGRGETSLCRFSPSVPSRHDPVVAGIRHTPTVGCSCGNGCGSYTRDCAARSGPASVRWSIYRPSRGHSESGDPTASRPRYTGPRRNRTPGFGMAAGRPVYRQTNQRWTAASGTIVWVAATAVATTATDCRRMPDPSYHGVMAARDAWGKTACRRRVAQGGFPSSSHDTGSLCHTPDSQCHVASPGGN